MLSYTEAQIDDVLGFLMERFGDYPVSPLAAVSILAELSSWMDRNN